MSEQEKKIMETFERVLPKMTDDEQERLLAFSEGLAFFKGERAGTGAEAN